MKRQQNSIPFHDFHCKQPFCLNAPFLVNAPAEVFIFILTIFHILIVLISTLKEISPFQIAFDHRSHLATSIRNLKKNNMFLILTYLMLFRYIRMEKSKNWIYDDVLFCKSSLSKMASVKTNKIKNRTAL